MSPTALSPAQLATLRGLLEERARRLRGELGSALHASGERATLGFENPRENTDDDGAADAEAALLVANAQRDARELEGVEAALARLDSGAYGECIDCGDPIAWARLQANPSTLRCIDCETAAERRARPPSAI